jgi:peptidyl-dipeptidase Dcp
MDLTEDKKTRTIKDKFTVYENVLAETQAFQMHLRTKRLIRLTRRHDRRKVKKRRLDFTLDYPSYVPFVTYADNGELRKMAIAFEPKVFKTMNWTTSKMLNCVLIEHNF